MAIRSFRLVPPVGVEQSVAWALALLGVCIGALPILLTSGTALQDWPSHLARVEILAAMLKGDPPWAALYTLNPVAWANSITDIVTLALLRAGLAPVLAGKLVVLGCYALFIGGFMALARATTVAGPLKLILGCLLFYNAAVFFGLISYMIGLGALMACLAMWLSAGPKARLGLATLGVVALFGCHLVAAALFAVIVATFDLWALWTARGRNWWQSQGLIAPVTVWLLLRLSAVGGGDFAGSWVGAPSVAGILYWKLSIFARIWLGGAPPADWIIVALGLMLVLTIPFACRLRFASAAWLMVAITTLVALAAPQRLGAGSLLDFRLAAVPVLLAAATLDLRPRRPQWYRLVFALVLTAGIARAAALTAAWQDADRLFATLDARLARLPPGGVVLSGLGRPTRLVPWREYWSPAVGNVATLGVAHGLFVPTVFAHPAQQLLALQPDFREWSVAQDVSGPAELARVRARTAPLCRAFAGGVHLLVIYPTNDGLPGMERIAERFGLVDVCGPDPT